MRICLTTVVDTFYSEYIPLFVWCAKRAYPEYHVKIFVRGKHNQMDGAQIVENIFSDHKYYGYNTIAARFVIPKKHFEGFTHIYITDIDMMLVRENPMLHLFHINEMQQTGLCYSNSTRPRGHWKGRQSLTGLHFCSFEWFKKTEEVSEKYRKYLKETPVRREYDGHMLYMMCKESGLKIAGKYPLVPRHHGIHLGNFRIFNQNGKLNRRMGSYKCREWMEYWRHPIFKKICNNVKSAAIRKQLLALKQHCEKICRKSS